MHNLVRAWVIGGLAILATAASTVLNAVIAVNNTSNQLLQPSLRALLFVALAFSFVGVLSLIYFTILYVWNVKSQSLRLKKTIWIIFALGAVVGLVSIALPVVSLIWLVTEQEDLSPQILGSTPTVWIAAWFACCGVAFAMQLALFIALGIWTRKQLKNHSQGRLDIDFGTRLPPVAEVVPDEHRSFASRDTTVVELPRTPSSKRPGSSSLRHSEPIKVPATSSRTRLVGHSLSAQSSMEMPAFSAGEARPLDNAFDRWDTSSVHSEMRAAVASSPVMHGGLETIPGSRPESPEDGFDGQTLPSSPPQAISSDTPTAVGDWSSSPPRGVMASSPPSSPPNFSRPTSKRGKNPLSTAAFGASMQEMIHPLFRSSSPQPPPIAIAGTMVTASPMADAPITPRTLATLRSNNKSTSTVYSQYAKPTGHWRAMPSVSQYSDRRPSTSGSQGPGSPLPGSPGPSIVDEEELPPILPGFVLGAGQRSSMLNYTNRKSVKRGSRLSTGI